MSVLRKVRGNPNAEITIYRATPGSKINRGDWITLSKSYAKWHNQSQFDGKANVLEMRVKAKDVQYAGDDINEFGYFPDGDIKNSISNKTWQEYLEENYRSTGTRTNMQNIKIPTVQDIQSVENSNIDLPNPNRVLNPLEISKLTPEDASTTPPLPNVRRNRVNDGNSSFASNIQNKTNMLNEEQKGTILSDEEVRYYDKITNKESLEKAFEKLNNNGRHETESWFAKDSENATATDIAEGWILLKQYADNNDSDGMVAVAKKLRDMGTKAGEKAGEELLGPAYGAAGATLGTVLGALIALAFLGFVLWTYRGKMRRQYRTDRSHKLESYQHILKVLVFTALPILFSTAIYNINQILDLTIFNHIMEAQGFTEDEYMALQGIYSGKYDTLVNVPLSIPTALCASVVPSLTAAVATRSKKLVHAKIDQTLRLNMVITIPCGVGFLVLASPLMVLLYNDASATPAYLLMIGSVVVVLYSWASILNSILHGLNYISSPAKNAGIALVVHLIAFVIMMTVFKMNVYALAAGNIVFSLCMYWLDQRKVHKVCGFRINIMDTFIKPLIASAVMGVIAYVVYFGLDKLIGGRWIPICVALAVAVVVYVVVVLKIGTLSEDDITALPMGVRLLRYCKKLHLLPQPGDE